MNAQFRCNNMVQSPDFTCLTFQSGHEPETNRLCVRFARYGAVNTHIPAIKKSHSGVTNSWLMNPKALQTLSLLNSKLGFKNKKGHFTNKNLTGGWCSGSTLHRPVGQKNDKTD